MRIGSPLSGASSNLAKVFMAMPSPIEREQRQAKADYQRALTEKATLDTQLAQRKLDAQSSVSDLFTRMMTTPVGMDQHGVDGLNAELADRGMAPTEATPVLKSADERVRASAPQLAQLAFDGGVPGQLAQLFRFAMANTDGTSDDAIGRSMLGAGGAFSSTPQGTREGFDKSYNIAQMQTDRTMAMQDRIDARTPQAVIDPTDPAGKRVVLVPKAQAVAQRMTPAAMPSGAPGTPRNYITADGKRGITLNGTTDSATGEAIPAGATVFTGQVQPGDVDGLTKGDRSKLIQNNADIGLFNDYIGRARTLADDPTAFGLTGYLRGTVQEAVQQGNALGQWLGQGQQEAQKELAAKGAPPQLLVEFDPRLPQLAGMRNLLAYQAAKILSGQQGRDVSDKDYAAMKRLVGDDGMLSSQAGFRAALDQLDELTGLSAARNKGLLPNAPGAANTTAAPPKRIRLDASGNPIQ